MPTPIILDKKLSPNTKYNFRINLTIGDLNVISKVFELFTPNAAPLMSRTGSNFSYKILQNAGDKETKAKSWTFDRFQIIKIGGDKCIQLRFPAAGNDFTDLNKTEKPRVKFNTSNSFHLAGLHNKKLVFVEKKISASKQWMLISFLLTEEALDEPSEGGKLDNKPVNRGYEITGANRTINLEEVTVAIKNTIQVTVSEPNITNKLVRRGSAPTIGAVHDILIFTYRQYDGSLNSKTKMKYITDNIGLNPSSGGDPNVIFKETLEYSNAVKYYLNNNKQKSSIKVKLDPKKGKKFIIYATVVRYVYEVDPSNPLSSPSWRGSWLQVNVNEEPIFGRAILSE